MNNLIEKKVAYGTGAGGIVTLILGLAATYHWFTPPPPYLTALGVSLLSGLVGYLAPHTTLPGDGQPVQAYIDTSAFTDALRVMRADLAAWLGKPSAAVQPSATGTAAPVAASVSISDPAPLPAGLPGRVPGSYPYPQPPATGGTTS